MERDFKVYLLDDREYFEYTDAMGQKIKKDLAFTQSLMDLLYLDIWPYLDLTGKIGDNIQELRESRKYETSCEIKNGLQELAKSHFYFELARIEWDQRLEKVADQSYNEIFNLLPYKKVTHIPSDIQTMQSEIKSLLLSVLDILSPDEPIQKKMVGYIHEIRQTFRVNIDAFYFTKLTTTFEQVDAEHVAEVLRPKDIHEIIEFFLRACVQREQRFRVCKNCGKYFALSGYTNTEYCDRFYGDTGKTCKEIGALNTWQKKRTENPVVNAYSKAYKKRFAWIKYHKTTKEAFYEWSEQARAKRDFCLQGGMTLEEFRAWLDE
jgi:hypothetical protein